MKYQELIRAHKCPFCPRQLNDPAFHQVIRQTKKAALMTNRAPYVKDHLMVVPLRHITNLESLTATEFKDMAKFVKLAVALLKKCGHKAYSILARQGQGSGKSIQHVHLHVIPDTVITDKVHALGTRRVISDDSLLKITRNYQKLLNL